VSELADDMVIASVFVWAWATRHRNDSLDFRLA